MTCGTCKHLKVDPSPSGRIIIRAGDVWPCIAPDPEEPKIPASMLKRYGWSWPPSRCYMQRDDGEGCATYEPRAKP
jgi:hypothetical protein